MTKWYHPPNLKTQAIEKGLAILIARLIAAGLIFAIIFFAQLHYIHLHDASSTDAVAFWMRMAFIPGIAGIIVFFFPSLLNRLFSE